MDNNNMNTQDTNANPYAAPQGYETQTADGQNGGQFSGGQYSGGPVPQNGYNTGQQPYQPAPYQPELEEPVSLMDYLGSLLLFTFVPCVGLIVCIIWAFSKDTKKSKANFCKAYLIIQLITIALTIIMVIAIFAMIGSMGYNGYYRGWY